MKEAKRDRQALGKPPSRGLLVALVLTGLAGRIFLCDLATQEAYYADHCATLSWGATADKWGLFHIYRVAQADLVPVEARILRNGQWVSSLYTPTDPPNHPPLSVLLYWAQARALTWGGAKLTPNTTRARLTTAAVPILFDVATAGALFLLTRRLFGHRKGMLAGFLCWLCPPLAMNSCYWGQVDSLFLAPAVLCLFLLLRRQWVAAGLAAGLAALFKPQAVLLGPLFLYASIVLPRAGEGRRPSLSAVLARLLVAGGVGAAVVLLLGLPWTLQDGGLWIRRCYVDNLVQAFPETTMKAFNFWYVDLLRLDGLPALVSDSGAVVWGLSKDAWGRLMLLTAVGAAAILCWRAHRRQERGLVAFAAFWLWSMFLWPTRVHERYILYALPPMIVLAVGMRRYWPALLGLLIVATAEHCWNNWMKGPPAGTLIHRRGTEVLWEFMQRRHAEETAQLPPQSRPAPPTFEEALQQAKRLAAQTREEYLQKRSAVRPWEILVTSLSLLSYALAVGALVLAGSPGATGPPTGPPRGGRAGDGGRR